MLICQTCAALTTDTGHASVHVHLQFMCVCAVRHSLVYRFCSEDGEWAPKNTSECEDDPAEVREGGVASWLDAGWEWMD